MISLLYVDDEPVFLELVKSLLESPGNFSVDTKLSAQEGLDALASHHYDAIVSDYMMPETDGISFLKQVREQHGDIPFIMLTGRGREEVVIKALNNGADFYLQKFGDPQIVFVELRHILKQCIAIRQTKKNLLEREERYHDLQNANDLIQSVAPDGRFLYVNKKWLETLGYEEKDLEKLRIFDIIHPESLDHCMTTFQRVISGENVGIIDADFKTRDGKRVYLEGIANCRLKDEKPQYTRGIFKDVTDRKIAEAALRDSEARFRTLIDSIANLAIQGYGPDGTVHYWNKANESVYGYTRKEAIGKNLLDLIIPPDMRDFVKEAIRHGAETGEMPPAGELNLMRRDGSLVPVFSSHARIQIHGHEPEMFCLDVDISERKKMEEIIRKSEERFRALVETTRDMVWEVDKDDRYTYISPQVLDILGYLPKEVLKKTCFDLMPPDEAEKIRKQFTKIASAGKPIERLENICLHKDGRRVMLETSGEPVHAADGSVVGYRGIDRDITERKRAEEALHIFKALVENSSDAIGMSTPDGKHYYQNATFDRLFGEIGTNPPETLYVDKAIGRLVFDTIMGGGNWQGEVKLFRKDRTILDILVRAYAIKNQEGHIIGLVGLHTDITERKQAEEALRESEQKFRSLVEHALDGILILDLQGTILFANNAVGRIIETEDLPAVMGRNVMEFIAPESREDVMKDFMQISQGHDAYLAYYQAISARGNRIYIESIGKVIRYEGKPADLVSIRDITERKQAEEALRQANKKLTMLSSITRHDIRNNLLTLRSYIYLAEQLVTDEKVRQYLTKQDNAAAAIGQQIDFTKDYESIGVKAPAWQQVYEIISRATALIDQKRVTVRNDTADLEIYADSMLGKVFYNLIDNSLRYGETISEIDIYNEKTPEGLIIVVKDNGIGIPADDKEKIFLKGYGKNTGLGLFLSREILSISGITIKETGEPGKGARFEITVPKEAFRFRQTPGK